MFKILDIVQKDAKNTLTPDSACFYISIRFTVPEEHHFGRSGKYYRAVMVNDIEKYESYWEDPLNTEYDESPSGENTFQMVFKKPSPYDTGLCKMVDIVGEDIVHKQEDGTYIYQDYISKNYITDAAVKQLFEMKEHMDQGFCRWGDYPNQNGAFRSGDAFHDFIGIVETFHRFWD